jgi:hypothetical protein
VAARWHESRRSSLDLIPFPSSWRRRHFTEQGDSFATAQGDTFAAAQSDGLLVQGDGSAGQGDAFRL